MTSFTREQQNQLGQRIDSMSLNSSNLQKTHVKSLSYLGSLKHAHNVQSEPLSETVKSETSKHSQLPDFFRKLREQIALSHPEY